MAAKMNMRREENAPRAFSCSTDWVGVLTDCLPLLDDDTGSIMALPPG
jgi:hypothetical protein